MRRLAHLLGWHTPACLGDPRCTHGGAAVVTSFGWHRHLADRGAGAC